MIMNRAKYIFLNLELQLYVCLCLPDMVCKITITKDKIILQNVLFHIITDFSNHKGTNDSEDEQRPVLVSAHPPPKIRQKILFAET